MQRAARSFVTSAILIAAARLVAGAALVPALARTGRSAWASRYLVSLVVATVVLSAATNSVAQFSPVLPEFQINSSTTGDVSNPKVVELADGSFLVVWESGLYPVRDIYGRRVDFSTASPLGPEFQLNSYTTGMQFAPSIAVGENGTPVAVWNSGDQDGSGFGVFGRRLSAQGTAIGSDFQVNTYTTLYQMNPSVGALAGGGFVVGWMGVGSATDSYGRNLAGFDARFLDDQGVPLGTPFRVSDPDAYYYIPVSAEVAPRPDGGFVVAWTLCYSDCDSITARARLFDAAGAPLSNVIYAGAGPASATSLPDSSFVVAGHGTQIDYYQDVQVRRFDSNGTQTASFVANTYTTDGQAYPDVASFSDGSFLVVWTSGSSVIGSPPVEQDGSGSGIFGQVFAYDGTRVGTEFQVNAYTTGDQLGVSVGRTTDPGFVAVWQRSTGVLAGRRFVPTCGDGVTILGEDCDDGNVSNGDCCDSSCRFEAAGLSCDDGDLCNGISTCDGRGACVANPPDNCASIDNPDQLNSDCPDPCYRASTGCTGPVPAMYAGCCDGGDVCDPCPAQADNTKCDPRESASAVIGAEGGDFQTDEVNGTISATIHVPPGALDAPTSISVTENADVSNFALRKEGATTDVLSLSARPENQHFNLPVTVTVRWDDHDKDGIVDRGTCNGAGADAGQPCDDDTDCASHSCSDNSQVPELEGVCVGVTNPGPTISCSRDRPCSSGVCSTSALVLKRNSNRFSKDGIGEPPFRCNDHLEDPSVQNNPCEVAHADCSQPLGASTRTRARCCDPSAGALGNRTYGEWTFETCDFSEFMLGLEAAGLVPGKGTPKTDCAMEWAPNVPLNDPYADAKGFPNWELSCHDGDFTCDNDGEVNGSCAFQIAMCMNVDDPRLVKSGAPQCTPSGVVAWTLLKPRPSAMSALEIANAQALMDAAATLGGVSNGEGFSFSPALAGPSVCTPQAIVRVPLAAPDKSGKAVLKVKTAVAPLPGKSKGPKDTDTLKLICLPPPVS